MSAEGAGGSKVITGQASGHSGLLAHTHLNKSAFKNENLPAFKNETKHAFKKEVLSCGKRPCDTEMGSPPRMATAKLKKDLLREAHKLDQLKTLGHKPSGILGLLGI